MVVRPDMDLGEIGTGLISKVQHEICFRWSMCGKISLGVVVLDDIRNIMFRQELVSSFPGRKSHDRIAGSHLYQ